MMRRTLLGIAVTVMLSMPSLSRAGDGECVPLVVNMTPDGSDDASRACGTAIRRALRRSVGSFDSLGESRMRAHTAEAGDAAATESDFLTWDSAALDEVVWNPRITTGSIVLFDCRPTEQIFRALVVPQAAGHFQVQLHGPLMSEETALMALDELLRYHTVGWSP